MNKFTPGPWKPYVYGAHWGIEALSRSIVVWGEEYSIMGVLGNTGEESKGNARLIAAAPDMYEALKYARRFMKKEDVDAEYIDKVIEKAEGTAQQEEKDE